MFTLTKLIRFCYSVIKISVELLGLALFLYSGKLLLELMFNVDFLYVGEVIIKLLSFVFLVCLGVVLMLIMPDMGKAKVVKKRKNSRKVSLTVPVQRKTKNCQQRRNK